MQYFLDTNAHTGLNLTQDQLNLINNNVGIFGNPHSPNLIGRAASNIIENAREKIADLLGAKDSSNIIFTNSCTEANHWACLMLSNNYLIKHCDDKADHIVKLTVSPYEHSSIEDSLVLIPMDKDYVRLNKAADITKLDKNDYAIYIAVQNEIGIISDLRMIKENTNKLLFADMAQAVGKVPINLSKEPIIDIATFGAHKFGGPTGVGILYLRDTSLWCPLNNCKSYNMDVPGSMNVVGIWQTAFALENAIKNKKDNMNRAFDFKFILENRLEDLGFEIIGKMAMRIATTTLAKAPNGKGLELLLELENYGINIGLGSACGSIIKQPLRSVEALGYKNTLNTEFIRISQEGKYNRNDAVYICECIEKALKKLGEERC